MWQNLSIARLWSHTNFGVQDLFEECPVTCQAPCGWPPRTLQPGPHHRAVCMGSSSPVSWRGGRAGCPAARLAAWLAQREQGLSDAFQTRLRAKRTRAHQLIRLAQLFLQALSKSPKAADANKQLKVLVLVRVTLSQWSTSVGSAKWRVEMSWEYDLSTEPPNSASSPLGQQKELRWIKMGNSIHRRRNFSP